MKQFRSTGIAVAALLSIGCGQLPASFSVLIRPVQNLVSSNTATGPAYLRVVLMDITKNSKGATQASGGESAVLRLHAENSEAAQDRTAILNKTVGLTGPTTNAVIFDPLSPGNYVLTVTLFTLANGTGTSNATKSIDLDLDNGQTIGVTLTMNSGGDGETFLNSNIGDIGDFLRATGASCNNVLGGR